MPVIPIAQCSTATVAIALALTLACTLRTSIEYLIPDNYVGWVSVKCGVANAEALTKVGNRFRITVPVGGRVRTSSSCDAGLRIVEYWYVDASGRRVKELALDGDLGARVTRITTIGPRLGANDISGWIFWVGAKDPDEKAYQGLMDWEFNDVTDGARKEP